MKLRAYFFLVSATLAGAFILCTLPLERSLEHRFEDIKTSEVDATAQIASGILRAKQYLLTTYGGVISKDKDLASLFLTSRTEGKERLIGALAVIQKKTHCDIVDVIDSVRNRAFLTDLKMTADDIKKVDQEGSFTRFLEVSHRPALISFFPLQFFEEPVGILVFGYFLNGSVSEEISKAAKAQVLFVPSEKEGTPIRIEGTRGEILSANLFVRDLPISEVKSTVRHELFLAGSGSLVLLGVLAYLFISIGFLRYFRMYIDTFNMAAKNLERGIINDAPLRKYPIREITGLFDSFSTFVKALSKFQERIRHKTRIEARGEKAAQVAHDVNGPLTALEMATFSNTGDLKKQREIIRLLIKRIRNVVSTVSEPKQASDDLPLSEEALILTSISPLLEEILDEKRLQYSKSRISFVRHFSHHHDLSLIQPAQFQRVVANLIDNAVQAIVAEGTISIQVAQTPSIIGIEISDTGRGMPKDILHRIGERGFSRGKRDGSGLGLWHAKERLSSWGGSLSIDSTPDQGTRIRLSLLRAPLTSELVLSKCTEVVIVDDDSAIHAFWKKRFELIKPEVRTFHFLNAADFKTWSETLSKSGEGFIFLIDYDLGHSQLTGLDLIRSLGIAKRSFLVTGMENTPEIFRECQELGLCLVLKSTLADISIRFEDEGRTL